MPQLGFGVWQVPDDEADEGRRAPRWRPATGASTPPRSTATKRAPARPSPPPGSPVRSSSSPPSCGTASRVTTRPCAPSTPRWRSSASTTSTCTSSTGRCRQADTYVDTYKAFEKILADGRAKAIGVSNFLPAHLERLTRRDLRGPGGQPDRAAPAAPAGRVACLPRRARHRHRGLVAARPGQGAAGGPDRGRDRSEARPDTGPGGAALAPPARQRGDPQVRDARRGSRRTSTSSASSWTPTTWRRSRPSTRASGWVRTRPSSTWAPDRTRIDRGDLLIAT